VRGSLFENKDFLAKLKPFKLFVSRATFGDFDVDGVEDMGIGTAFSATQLYRQEADGSFSNREPNGSAFTRFPIFADMNNDGAADMLAIGPSTLFSGVLAINVGGGQFEVLPESSGFKFPLYSQITGITPIDIDDDGDLDVIAGFVSLFEDDNEVWRNIVVLRNNGDLTFTDVWAETGLGRLTGGHDYRTFDWNGDAFPDLLALHRYPNRVALHKNLGNGTFVDVTDTAFPDEFLRCQDWFIGICNFFVMAAVGDYDNDGDSDLLLTHSQNISSDDAAVAMLLDNDGQGVFSDVTAQSGDLATVALLGGRWGTSFFDLQNDGNLDILIPIDILLAGSPLRPPESKVVILVGDGNGSFTHISDAALPPDTQLATAVMGIGDYDDDGGQDILGPVGGFIGEVGGLMHNLAAQSNHWLKLQLDSVDSAPNGFGVRVHLVTSGREQTREVNYSPVEPWPVHFGLGGAAKVNLLEVHWPSGVVGIQYDVAVDQTLHLDESQPCPHLPGGQCPTIAIDVDPDSDENEVAMHSDGLLEVVILGADGFDIADIDLTTLFFGRGRATAQHRDDAHLEDLNGDGRLDRLLHYRVPDSRFELADVEVCIRGQLLDRTPFTGCDAVLVEAPNGKAKGTQK
jgi:hypothetical protein